LAIPANITQMPLPAKCPELNPVEDVSPFIRYNWLSNGIFRSEHDIVDDCCGAWNKLVEYPQRIMSF
jgi:transposase